MTAGADGSRWGPVSARPGEALERSFGSLETTIRREVSEVWLRATHDGASREGEDWVRWAVGASDPLELLPGLPDRPVVVSPEQPFYLPPSESARVFVRIPLFARLVRRAPRAETVLAEMPSIVLSDTWWGTFTEGELAYWITTRARRAVPPEALEPHLAICPLTLENVSDQPLPIERFAIRVAYLTLFGEGDAVWTDEVHVRYEGQIEGSELRYSGQVPEEAGDVARIAKSREAPSRGLHARTFGRLRALSGLSL